MPAHEQEGVIKFEAQHDVAALERSRYLELACQLVAWRELLTMTRLVGQDVQRYGGLGFGNISGRVGAPGAPRGSRSFLITGTQTGDLPQLTLDDFCLVQRYDYRRNQVVSRGLRKPSSESMTHGAVYDLAPHIRFVFHGHTPVIWRRARALRLPTTDERVAYGTQEMAFEVERLYRSSSLPETQVVVMGGHEDGVIVFGRSALEAGQLLLGVLARAYEACCIDQLGCGSCC